MVLLSLLALLPGLTWLSLPIAVGFLLRVAAGPRFSPLGLLATRLIAPRLGAAETGARPAQAVRPGDRRHAQHRCRAGLLRLRRDRPGPAAAGLIVVAATLESVFAICLGCLLFALADAGRRHLAGRLPGLQ